MSDFHLQRTRHVSLCEALDRVLNTGVVALGEVTLSVADIDLIYLGLQLVVTSVESGRELAPGNAGPQPVSDSRPRPVPGEETRFLDNSCGCGDMDGDGSAGALPYPDQEGRASLQPSLQPSQSCPAIEQTTSGGKPELIAGAIANPDSNREKNGLGRLVLTLMKVLHELLKRQALRRIHGGALTPAQVERLGVTLMSQAREIDRLREAFGLPEQDLNLDLGPLGKLL